MSTFDVTGASSLHQLRSASEMMQASADSQNDVADFLRRLITFLEQVAGFFDAFNTRAQSSVVTSCELQLMEVLKVEVGVLVQKVPSMLQTYLSCRVGMFFNPGDPVVQTADAQLGFGDFMKLLPTIVKYLPQIIELINKLKELVGNLPTVPPTNPPTGPLDPAFHPREVKRCG